MCARVIAMGWRS